MMCGRMKAMRFVTVENKKAAFDRIDDPWFDGLIHTSCFSSLSGWWRLK